MEDIEHYSIRIYNFPYDVEEDDEDTIEENSELRVSYIQDVCVCLCVLSSYLCMYVTHMYILLRRFYPSLLLAVMKKSLWMVALSAEDNILGVLLKVRKLQSLHNLKQIN